MAFEIINDTIYDRSNENTIEFWHYCIGMIDLAFEIGAIDFAERVQLREPVDAKKKLLDDAKKLRRQKAVDDYYRKKEEAEKAGE